MRDFQILKLSLPSFSREWRRSVEEKSVTEKECEGYTIRLFRWGSGIGARGGFERDVGNKHME